MMEKHDTIWICPVGWPFFGRQLGFRIFEHLPYLYFSLQMTADEEAHIFMYIDNVHTETTDCTVNFLKFRNPFLFLFSNMIFFLCCKSQIACQKRK